MKVSPNLEIAAKTNTCNLVFLLQLTTLINVIILG